MGELVCFYPGILGGPSPGWGPSFLPSGPAFHPFGAGGGGGYGRPRWGDGGHGGTGWRPGGFWRVGPARTSRAWSAIESPPGSATAPSDEGTAGDPKSSALPLRCSTSASPVGGAIEDVDRRLDIPFTVLQGQDEWILATSVLERMGFRFFTSLSPGEQSYIVTPALKAFALRRADDFSLLLGGVFSSPGAFEVGPGPDSLLCDNGATTCVAGRDWERRLNRLPGIGFHLRGVGGTLLRSVGRGQISLLFPVGANLRWVSAGELSLLTSKRTGLKILHPGEHLTAPRAPLLLQGTRIGRAVPEGGTTLEDDTLAAAITDAADAEFAPLVTPVEAGSALVGLLQRSEVPVPGPDARPSSRRRSRFPLLN